LRDFRKSRYGWSDVVKGEEVVRGEKSSEGKEERGALRAVYFFQVGHKQK
jgi:hypothetical protein